MEFDDDSANWRKSSIREWMNGPFYSQAFSNEEKDAVIKTSVDNSVRQRLSNCSISAEGKSKNGTERIFCRHLQTMQFIPRFLWQSRLSYRHIRTASWQACTLHPHFQRQ